MIYKNKKPFSPWGIRLCGCALAISDTLVEVIHRQNCVTIMKTLTDLEESAKQILISTEIIEKKVNKMQLIPQTHTRLLANTLS